MYNNLHQWYLAIGDSVETTEKYEDTILKFYKAIKDPKADKKIKSPILYEFYKKEPFSKHIGKFIASKLLLSVILGAIFALITWLVKVILADDTFIEAVKNSSNLIAAIVVFICSIITIEAFFILLSFLKYNSIVKKLHDYEEELKEIMISLPSGYRNSEKMKHIINTYYAQKGVEPEIAFTVCDQLYYDYKQRPYEGVMFDLPFRNNFVTDTNIIQNEQQVEQTEEEKLFENPNLPADIKSKTFKGSDDAQKDLNDMIGLDSVKDQISKLENRIKFYGSSATSNHMQFLGSAGTGKTTVARIVTKILYDLGYIKKNQYVEISGDYLRSGNTARADAILEYSMGGVLFIDEAYLLYDKLGINNDAIGILLKAMEDHRTDFVVILAGYEEQMTRLIASNEGFSSRIKHTIYFPDYTEEECVEIFKYFIKNYNGKEYKLDTDAESLLLEAFKLEKQAKSFGNARTVRNAADSIMDYYADRNIKHNSHTNTILAEDIDKYIEDRKVFLQHEVKNSSAANNIDESIIRLSELKPKEKQGIDLITEDFPALTGFETFKEEMDILKKQKDFGDLSPQNILLLSEPGCEAPLLVPNITGYLYKLGYIQENKYLEIPAEFLKGSYVGHTSKRAQAIVAYATGGVLYIKGLNDLQDDNFSTEVRNVISEALAEHKVTIIVYDYVTDYINNISNMFNITYVFPKHTADVLARMFIDRAYADSFSVDPEAVDKVQLMLANKNIKDMNNIYEKAKKKHIATFTEATKYIIVAQDIEKPTIKLNRKIGFNV